MRSSPLIATARSDPRCRWCEVRGHDAARSFPLPAARSAYLLIESVVYLSILFVLLGVGYCAFYHCMGRSVALRRSTDDIAHALHAGEVWRADLRTATGPIRLENDPNGLILIMPGTRGVVAYQSTTNAVLRCVNSGPWATVLERVKSSTMVADPRSNVTAWRWELELLSRSRKPARVCPLFTFIAVPERRSSP